MLSIPSTKQINLRNLITCSKQLDFVQDIVRAASSSLLVHFSPRGMSSKPSLTFRSSSLHDVQIEINLCSIYKETSTITYTNTQFEKFINIRYKVNLSYFMYKSVVFPKRINLTQGGYGTLSQGKYGVKTHSFPRYSGNH